MSQLSAEHESKLLDLIRAGDLAAYDEMATIFYEQAKYQESADLYLKAYVGGYYKSNDRPISSRNIYDIWQRGLIPHNSEAARLFQHLRTESVDTAERARKAATRTGVAVFIAYPAIIFGGGVTGILRDFSLVIAAGLAWLAWKMVLSSFEK